MPKSLTLDPVTAEVTTAVMNMPVVRTKAKATNMASDLGVSRLIRATTTFRHSVCFSLSGSVGIVCPLEIVVF